MTGYVVSIDRLIVIGDSVTSNSLGRVLSMAITSTEIAETLVFAVDDGPVWPGIQQFGGEVETFPAHSWRSIADRVIEMPGSTAVWFSKGAAPLSKIAKRIAAKRKDIPLIADFDDDDVAIMQDFVHLSIINRLKMPPTRRKSPGRLLRNQRSLAMACRAVSFSNEALRSSYSRLLRLGNQPVAIVPHSRRDNLPVLPAEHRRSERGSLTVAFPGTMRAHKGAGHMFSLLRSDNRVRLLTFRQAWSFPQELQPQIIAVPPHTELRSIYADADFLVLPMSRTPAAEHQLPAKLIDAAVNGTPIAATPTAAISSLLSVDDYVVVHDWSDAHAVLSALRAADGIALSARSRAKFEEMFSPLATSTALRGLLRAAAERSES